MGMYSSLHDGVALEQGRGSCFEMVRTNVVLVTGWAQGVRVRDGARIMHASWWVLRMLWYAGKGAGGVVAWE